MKKVVFYIIFLFVFFFGVSIELQAQDIELMYEPAYVSPVAHVEVSARIIKMFQATEFTPLNFGKVALNDAGVQIEITPTGMRKVSGSIDTKDKSYSPARYYISGGNLTSCKVQIPNEPIILTNFRDSKTIVVSDWSADYYAENGTGTNDGLQAITLGATLNVGSKADNPAGVYDGTYDITFLYN